MRGIPYGLIPMAQLLRMIFLISYFSLTLGFPCLNVCFGLQDMLTACMTLLFPQRRWDLVKSPFCYVVTTVTMISLSFTYVYPASIHSINIKPDVLANKLSLQTTAAPSEADGALQ